MGGMETDERPEIERVLEGENVVRFIKRLRLDQVGHVQRIRMPHAQGFGTRQIGSAGSMM